MPSDSPQDDLVSVIVPVFGAADALAELSERVLTAVHRLRVTTLRGDYLRR